MSTRWLRCLIGACLLGCEASETSKTLSREELLDPETCKDCHPKHYREWSASMHAYAARDPVFLAMNQRGQEETNGELGDFCIQCHAPMALVEMPDADFSELEIQDLPAHLQGVTCYFCHNATGVGDHFNGDVKLANDTTMRGGIRDPVQPAAHRAEYSAYHDRRDEKSAQLCGACHDIVTPKGVELERTLQEWEASIFAEPGLSFQTCQSCHMKARSGVAAEDPDTEVPLRRLTLGGGGVHDHLWAAVDVALDDFPHRQAMELAVEQCELANSIGYALLEPAGDVEFQGLTLSLETNAGHHQPSGATQDRRMWVELVAYDAEGNVIFESGTIEDGELEEKPAGDPDHDPNLWLFRDRIFDEAGNEVHMFWEAASYDDTQNRALPVATPVPAGTPLFGSHTLQTTYPFSQAPARVTIRVRMRPIGLDVLDSLVESGHLDAGVRDAMPTFTAYSAEAEWPDPSNPRNIAYTETTERDCRTYRCMLDPASEDCGN